MKNNKLLIIGAWLLGAFSLNAQKSMSIDECISYALENHISVKNSELDQKKADYKINETKASGLPQINAKIDAMANLKVQSQFVAEDAFNPLGDPNKTTPLEFGVPYTGNGSITLTQMLYNSSFFIGLEAAKTYKMLSAQSLEKTKEDLKVDVVKAYYGVLVNDQRAELLLANKSQLDQLYDDVTKMYDQGVMEEIELTKISVSLNNLITELDKIASYKKISLNLLKYNIGMPLEEELTLTQSLEDLLSSSIELSGDLNIENRIDYQMLETQLTINELNEKNYKYNSLPSAALFGTVGSNYGAIELSELPKLGNWENYGYVGFQIDIPIFTSFKNKSLVQQTLVEKEVILNQMTMFKDGVELENYQLKETYLNYKSSLDRLDSNQKLAQKVYDNAEIKFKNGVGSNYDIIIAETQLKEAQTNYLGAVYDLLITKVDLDKSSGNFK